MTAAEHTPRKPEFTARGHWVGASVRRLEDPRLLTGKGAFVDDIHLPRMLHAQFVRSTVAAGTVTAVDLSGTLAVPGVVAAFTAHDLEMGDVTAVLDRPLSEFVPTAMPV